METISVLGRKLGFHLSLPCRSSSFPDKRTKHVHFKAITCDGQLSNRKFRKLPPSEWTHHFHSVSLDVSEMDALKREIDILKPKVKNMFMSSQGTDRILMIYLLDIRSLHIFRFKESNGNFKETLKGDAKGILSLYEAAHLRTTKDYILEEALTFTSSHLKSLVAVHIQNALFLSQRWNMEMLVAVKYIPFYDQEDDHDEMLLKFAKISFRSLQLQYLQELKILTNWYKDVDIASKLPPYFRDRLVESHFLIQAVFIEPQVSRARIMLTQYYTILGIIDDTFDRYASLPEAEILANSVKRWSPNHAMDKQPQYLKDVKAFVKANFEHAKWAQATHLPSFEEYMEVAEVEITPYVALAGCFMCLGKMTTKEAYKWLKSRPRLVKSVCVRGRLMNDITGLEDDMSRGQITNAVNCYMKQYGVTKQDALRELHQMVVDTDNIINEELLTTTDVSRLVLKTIMGLAQSISVLYNGYEGFTFPEGKIKEYMTCVFVN
ncbi:unnamed protein product [Eruca vesicaria subsp. sativa]|uniref:Uncharacterized protein n=1 Tax=Eruca vesicaria subsp. sativa TaxID=29727 RepID=A0ABC8L9D0_ERUVS|nr:unnamed protein product [Eruca vesicaria subsp. sativa]